MITGSPIPDGSGWVPVPNETARDKRISRRALGLLVELLAYPSGWDNTADSLSAKGREGREATRSAMRELESAGYVVQVRYSAGGGLWRTAAFAGSMPEVARKLADTWLAENPNFVVGEKPRSHRGTGFRASDNQASVVRASDSWASSTYKTDDKTDRKTVDQDHDAASAASCSSDAYASDTGDAVASPRDKDQSSQAEQGQPRRRRAKKQSLGDYLTAMDGDEVDDILTELECSRTGIVDWALPIAREALRMAEDADPHDDLGGRLAVKVLTLALPRLYRQSGLPTVVDDALAGFDWPYQQDWYAEPAPSKPRERTHTSYAYAKKGVGTEKILDDAYAAVSGASVREIAGLTEAFRANRPRIFHECTQHAVEQLELTDTDADSPAVMRLALKYGLRHYSDDNKWPLWLLPESMRPADREANAA